MSEILRIVDLKFRYSNGFSLIIENFSVEEGDFVGLIGPNGAGKTTLLKIVLGLLKPLKGRIELFGKDLKKMKRKEIARKITMVSQEFIPIYDFKVKDIILTSRIPHRGMFDTENERDLEIMRESLKMVGLEDFEERRYWSLSGGERRRALIAKALAQETDIIVLDELTAHLDPKHILEIAEVLKKLVENGKTVISAFHNINIASKICNKLVALKNGRIIASGRPEEIIKTDVLEKLYGIKLKVLREIPPQVLF